MLSCWRVFEIVVRSYSKCATKLDRVFNMASACDLTRWCVLHLKSFHRVCKYFVLVIPYHAQGNLFHWSGTFWSSGVNSKRIKIRRKTRISTLIYWFLLTPQLWQKYFNASSSFSCSLHTVRVVSLDDNSFTTWSSNISVFLWRKIQSVQKCLLQSRQKCAASVSCVTVLQISHSWNFSKFDSVEDGKENIMLQFYG